jgi:hypothetical protein
MGRSCAPRRLEKAQQHDRVRDVADVECALNGANQTGRWAGQKCEHAAQVEVGQQFAQLQHELLLLRHRHEISARAVDQYDAGFVPLDIEAKHLIELAGR